MLRLVTREEQCGVQEEKGATAVKKKMSQIPTWRNKVQRKRVTKHDFISGQVSTCGDTVKEKTTPTSTQKVPCRGREKKRRKICWLQLANRGKLVLISFTLLILASDLDSRVLGAPWFQFGGLTFHAPGCQQPSCIPHCLQ